MLSSSVDLLEILATHVQHHLAQANGGGRMVVQLTQLGLHFIYYYYPLKMIK